jgi:hypothetical protein
LRPASKRIWHFGIVTALLALGVSSGHLLARASAFPADGLCRESEGIVPREAAQPQAKLLAFKINLNRAGTRYKASGDCLPGATTVFESPTLSEHVLIPAVAAAPAYRTAANRGRAPPIR